jgi:hypothetical protein
VVLALLAGRTAGSARRAEWSSVRIGAAAGTWPRPVVELTTAENRGVPGSSPGLAIAESSCKSAVRRTSRERLRATEARRVPNERVPRCLPRRHRRGPPPGSSDPSRRCAASTRPRAGRQAQTTEHGVPQPLAPALARADGGRVRAPGATRRQRRAFWSATDRRFVGSWTTSGRRADEATRSIGHTKTFGPPPCT